MNAADLWTEGRADTVGAASCRADHSDLIDDVIVVNDLVDDVIVVIKQLTGGVETALETFTLFSHWIVCAL